MAVGYLLLIVVIGWWWLDGMTKIGGGDRPSLMDFITPTVTLPADYPITSTPADRSRLLTPFAVLPTQRARPTQNVRSLESGVVEVHHMVVITVTPSPTPYIMFQQTNVPILTAAPCSTWLEYGKPVPEECYFAYIRPDLTQAAGQ